MAEENLLFRRTVEILKRLIRIDTSRPGNESEAALYLREVLAASGIESELTGPEPSRKSIIARVRGAGAKPPLLLLSHLDVVPADPASWTHPPFAAEEADGFIWGRGAIDMKMMTAMETAILCEIAENGTGLERDIILAATAGEEEGGEPGLGWIAENAFDKIEAEYALSEVGGFSLKAGRKRLYPVMVSEKGFCWLKIRFPGTPGHGSLPRDDHALRHAATGIARLLDRGFPLQVVEPVGSFLRSMADGESFPRSMVLRGVATPPLTAAMIRLVPAGILRDRMESLLRNTANPTMLNSGTVRNMMPEYADLTVDCRILPGTSVRGFTDEVSRALGDGCRVEIENSSEPQRVTGAEEMIGLLDDVIRRHDTAGEVVPYMITGFTDGRHINPRGVKCLGFTPLKIEEDFPVYELIHGIDERVPVDGLEFGTAVLRDVLNRWCVTA